MINIDALNMDSRELNKKIKESIEDGHKEINIINVLGQRFIGNGIQNKELKITINGTVGNDLGMFMDGVDIELFGNAQDGVGNTLNSGTICVHGRAGDKRTREQGDKPVAPHIRSAVAPATSMRVQAIAQRI